jgi:hypothetical protein
MAIFNFGGQQADSSNGEDLIKAAQEAGVKFGGSVVAGDSHGVTGGTVNGDVKGTETSK